jgi:DNA polymerase III epsilon subunit family exonuclease
MSDNAAFSFPPFPEVPVSTHPFAQLLKYAARGELFHVTDVETTGLSSDIDRIIELATVTVRDGEIVDRFQTLVNPGEVVSALITRITGINTGMLEGAPPPEVALKRWINYLGGEGQFVAHNAQFDWGFLKAECARAGLEFPFKRKFCTMKIAGHFFPSGGRLKLEHMVKRFGVEPAGSAHRAMADAESAARIFLKELEHLQAGTIPAPTGTPRVVAPFDPSGDPWEAVLRYLKPRSLVTAAVLGQHTTFKGREADGTFALEASPDHVPFVENSRTMIEEALEAVYGEKVPLRLDVRTPVQ